MSNPNHFDHDDHRRKLQRAADELESLGRHDLAAAVSRARSLHLNMMGRVSHARQASRNLRWLAERSDFAREAKNLIDRYVAQPEAPWLEPAPVLFPPDE